ncbi:hypothetical protein [Aquimarina agarivorans]|uniref:hypothetical protein n=1 Tax=Aquimarina agarivorans TaxID=980584 RepID=UPI000248FC44|nr:hypothetical protein [Aquimarina agarivorans]
MYKTKAITKKELQAVSIKNQEEITELTGCKLDLFNAWGLIKSTSKNFTVADLKAQEADALLYEIVNPGKKKKTKPNSNSELIRLQEKERARALELLELELLIAA